MFILFYSVIFCTIGDVIIIKLNIDSNAHSHKKQNAVGVNEHTHIHSPFSGRYTRGARGLP